MSFFSSLFCCCKTSSPLDNCNDSTAMWKSDSPMINTKLLDVFEKSEIRFFGLFEERIENKPYDMSLFSKEGVKKITFGKNHIVILLSMCYIIYIFIFNWLINLENNKIAVWGANQNGQLGLPLSEPIIPEIKINNLSAIKNIDSYRVIDVECSDDLTYLILEDIKTLKRKIIRLGVDGKDKYHLDKDVRNKKFIVSISF